MRESAKRSRHGEDVRRAGNTFTPLVFSTYGGMGRDMEAWFRGAIAVAEVEVPEHVRRGGDEARIEEYVQWARAELASAWRRRLSVCLHRGNARVLASGAARARDGVGIRVYGRMGSVGEWCLTLGRGARGGRARADNDVLIDLTRESV